MKTLQLIIFTLLASTIIGIISAQQQQQPHYTPDPFLQNWMGHLAPIINNVTLLDISVPASHDSGTYDLTQTVADNANDLPADIAWILHEFGGLIKDIDVGAFLEKNAKTQGLTFTQQLDSGLRFIDFRIDYTAPAGVPSTAIDQYDWYVMHLVESKQKAITYLKQMRRWLDEHPTEILILWVSHHGSNCNTSYRITNNTIKLQFWGQMEQVFDGMMFDASTRNLNETTIGELQQLGQRVVFYMGDYQNFTNSSNYAQWSCQIDNQLPGDGDPMSNVFNFLENYGKSHYRITSDKQQNMYYLMSGSGPTIREHLEYALELDYLGPLGWINETEIRAACAALYQIPGGATWCPQYLQENSQWANYYHQVALEISIRQQKKRYYSYGSGSSSSSSSLLLKNLGKNSSNNKDLRRNNPVYRFPNAIYIDAVDVKGTIRTGSQVFWPSNSSSSSNSVPTYENYRLDAKYAFADTLLLSNVFWICSSSASLSNDVCDYFINMLEERRREFPLRQWTDLSSGRLEEYPLSPDL